MFAGMYDPKWPPVRKPAVAQNKERHFQASVGKRYCAELNNIKKGYKTLNIYSV
jgi:hypothetical protein